MIAAAIALALQASSGSDADWARRTEGAMAAWKICVISTARSWSRQSAQPSDIAAGAIGHCSSADVEVALRSSPYLGPDQVDRIVADLKATWRDRAIAAVLEQRSQVIRKLRTK